MRVRQSFFKRRNGSSGLSLAEVLIAVGVGSLVLLVVGALSTYALRSFVAMGNYASLNASGRLALDRITRDVRQATGVLGCDQSGETRWIRFSTADPGIDLKYVWRADERTLVCETEGKEIVYLTECDDWKVALYQRTPIPGATNAFFPATNTSGGIDLSICKIVDMQWKCSRSLLGRQYNTESMQHARLVLRNR